MNYMDISGLSIVNGVGMRVVLWVAGCSHGCKGCQNPQTWDKNAGEPFDDTAKEKLWSKLDRKWIQGMTLSGGDPLFPDNREKVEEVCREMKERFPDKDIWMYTGFLWEEVRELQVMQYVDVLVDGEFDIEKKDPNYAWAGSRNQRIIDVPKTIQSGKVCLFEHYSIVL